MQYKNIIRYLEEVQESVQNNPGGLVDYDLRQIVELYEIAKAKNVKEVGKMESTLEKAKNAWKKRVFPNGVSAGESDGPEVGSKLEENDDRSVPPAISTTCSPPRMPAPSPAPPQSPVPAPAKYPAPAPVQSPAPDPSPAPPQSPAPASPSKTLQDEPGFFESIKPSVSNDGGKASEGKSSPGRGWDIDSDDGDDPDGVISISTIESMTKKILDGIKAHWIPEKDAFPVTDIGHVN